jgi:hypothetical protein
MILYTITTINPNARDFRFHTLAVCTSQESACHLIEINDLDLHEETDDYAVVATIHADVPYGLAFEDEEIWYHWEGSPDDGKYVLCDKPAEYTHIAFGL